jgi:hypothetical protein
MTAPAFSLRVHVYEENRQDGTRTLVSYTPFLRLGAPSGSGHAGEVCYLQHGYVYGEGGDPYAVEDLPAWFADALAALTPQARVDVGFTADRVQWYTGEVLAYHDVSPSNGSTGEVSPVLPSSPTWKLGWLCRNSHDYQGTGMSRYRKDMKCVDCEYDRKRKKSGVAGRPPAATPSAAD